MKNFWIHLKTNAMRLIKVLSAIIESKDGSVVADQFEATFYDSTASNFDEQNPNALKYIRETLTEVKYAECFTEDVINQINEYLEDLNKYFYVTRKKKN